MEVEKEYPCPHCKQKFKQKVHDGENILACPHCKKRSKIVLSGIAKAAGVAAPQIKLRGSYNDDSEALNDVLNCLGMVLGNEPLPIKFKESGEFLHPHNTIKRRAYSHLGDRWMSIYILKESVNEYKVIANEVHGATSMTPRRDELFYLNVMSGVKANVMDDFKMLDPRQRQIVTQIMYIYVDHYANKVCAMDAPEE